MQCAGNNSFNIVPQCARSVTAGGECKGLTTEGTEEHGGNPRLINVDLFNFGES